MWRLLALPHPTPASLPSSSLLVAAQHALLGLHAHQAVRDGVWGGHERLHVLLRAHQVRQGMLVAHAAQRLARNLLVGVGGRSVGWG